MVRTALLAALLLSRPVVAQHAGGHGTPYAGFGSREAASLSSEEAAGLRAGRGMGFALPAELNGYPGPLHAIELADSLDLSPAQLSTMQRLVAAMLAETIPLGMRLIEAERALDAVFAGGGAAPSAVDEASRDAVVARGELRAAHLRVHLATREAMTSEQREAYARLRGYRSDGGGTGMDPSPTSGEGRRQGG